MRILFINNDGGGFADHIQIDDGTTVQALFRQRLPHGRAESYLIRVNRQPASAEQVLHEGDRVSFTPTKIEGALQTHPQTRKEVRLWHRRFLSVND